MAAWVIGGDTTMFHCVDCHSAVLEDFVTCPYGCRWSRDRLIVPALTEDLEAEGE